MVYIQHEEALACASVLNQGSIQTDLQRQRDDLPAEKLVVISLDEAPDGISFTMEP